MWSGEWRCSWSSADRRCSNYIWVIINLISVPYIRDLTVFKDDTWYAPLAPAGPGEPGLPLRPGRPGAPFAPTKDKELIDTSWRHTSIAQYKTVLTNGRHFADNIFKCLFMNENVWISNEITLKFVHKGPINNTPALVQIMAWCQPGNKPLSGAMMGRLPPHICIIRPQWVKSLTPGGCGIDFRCINFICFLLITFMSIFSVVAFMWMTQNPTNDK